MSAAGFDEIAWISEHFPQVTYHALRYANEWDAVLKPVVARYQGKISRINLRSDVGFLILSPEAYEFLEAERIKYADQKGLCALS